MHGPGGRRPARGPRRGASRARRLAPVPGRIAVAMSGGVDSAVALTKAVEAGMSPVGVTLRLWVDPMRPTASGRAALRRPCGRRAMPATRWACRISAIDLRDGLPPDGGRRLRGAPTRAGRTPNPCVRCNGAFRFAAIARGSRIGSGRRGSRPATTPAIVRRGGTALVARGADPAKDQSYMLASVPSEILARCWFPLGDQTKARPVRRRGRRGWRRQGAPRARRCASSAAAITGRSSSAWAVRAAPATSSTRRAECSAGTTGLHRFTPGQRRGLGLGGGDAALRPSHRARDRPCRRGRPRGAGADLGARSARARMYVPARSGEGEAAVPPEPPCGRP